MAHELEMINGQAQMFSVKEVPWHQLGKVLQNSPSVEEAIKLAGLDWTVALKPMALAENGQPVPGAMATVRSTDSKILGVVGNTYKPLQNTEAFKFFEPFVQAGLVQLETAGSLRGGKRIWVMGKVKGIEGEVVKGDEVKLYVLLSNGHDGSLAIRVGFTPVRTVCANTLQAAHGNKASKLFRIRHTAKANETLTQVQEIMNAVKGEFEATMEQYRALTRKDINKKDLENFIRISFNLKAEEDSTKPSKVIDAVTRMFEKGRGNDLPGVAGTAYAAYQAAVEYLQYERGTSTDVRLNNLWFGDSATISKRALEQAMELAAA
jgi:phage/plasmid-like protein (TIGR03299 family)